jgi:hypothetical protein
MRRIPLLLALPPLLALVARAQEKAEKPVRADSPGKGVLMLKEAWEERDLGAIVARYVEPGASYVRSDIDALRHIERAQEKLGEAVRARLGPAAELVEVPKEPRFVSALANATLAELATRIKGDRASTKFRVATREGERFFRFQHVLQGGDWKIVLSGIDGIPLDERGFQHLAAVTEAHLHAAEGFERIAAELTAGTLSAKEEVRKQIKRVLDDEQAATAAEERGGRRDDGHEND